jgi:hypothetical protein
MAFGFARFGISVSGLDHAKGCVASFQAGMDVQAFAAAGRSMDVLGRLLATTKTRGGGQRRLFVKALWHLSNAAEEGHRGPCDGAQVYLERTLSDAPRPEERS